MTTRFHPTVHRALLAAAWCLLALASSTAMASGRVALLIGNNAYPNSPLRNAVNDTRDLSAALTELGFKTIVRENTSRAQMIAALQEFGKAIEGADAALFFYAGHAMQFKDRNYLIPIDAVMGSEDDVTFFSVEVAQVFDRMERGRTRFNFVILDACRDNPFRDTFKVTASGLAQMSGPSGTLIAYATAPGATAADGFGRNGVYTGHLLQNIKVPDMPAEVLFRKVREGVERETKRMQTPWELSSIKGEFAFNPSGRAAAGGTAPGTGPSADMAAQFELQFWKSVQDSTRADDIQAYLEKYPNGVFSKLARNRIDSLLGRKRDTAITAAASAPVTASPALPSGTAPGKVSPPEATTPEAATAKVPASPPDAVLAKAPASGAPVTAPPAAATPGREKVAAAAPAAPTAPRAAAEAPRTDAAAPSPALATTPKPREDLPGREISPGIREITFADGSVYVGPTRGVQLHGKGEYSSKAFKYQGEFRDGLKHGMGTYSWENGDRYEGQFADDHPGGRGKWRFANGDAYEGEVKAGIITGRGIYTTRTGDVIEGSFVAGQANGVGIYRFASGDRYEGEMSSGKLQGKGRYFTKDGDRIEAPFSEGRPQGKGTYYFANGDRYEGDIRNGVLSGSGTYFHAAGQKYEGEMVDGRPHGKGAFWFADGSRFEGVFENGLTRAKGTLITVRGNPTPAEIVDGAVKILE